MIGAPPSAALARIHGHLADLGVGTLALYKEPCFARRLASRMRVCRDLTTTAYADRLDRDPEERQRLVTALSIGVTSFFRNPEAWRRLAVSVDRFGRVDRLEAWSAGCSSGEEAYSLALLIDRLAERGAIGEWRVVGTDIDRRGLVQARTGRYPRAAAALIEAQVGPGRVSIGEAGLEVPEALRRRVTFHRADLSDAMATPGFDVVTCRNVLIYFGAAGQERMVANLIRAVKPGGLLMLGKAEVVAGPVADQLEVVDRAERIYRRPG